MYYEEQVIDGVLHWRGTPVGDWRPMSAERVTAALMELRGQRARPPKMSTFSGAAALSWRDAAVADGWSIHPYRASKPIEQAWFLKRDGYVVHFDFDAVDFGARVGGWSPIIDGRGGLDLDVPNKYSWSAVLSAPRRDSLRWLRN